MESGKRMRCIDVSRHKGRILEPIRMEFYDVVVCLGPKDVDIFKGRLANFQANLLGARNFFVVTAEPNSELVKAAGGEFVDERIFPFTIPSVEAVLGKEGRGGWYFQQLLKLYAAQCIPGLLENFLIVDVDVHFHRPIGWFYSGNVQFNCGSHIHEPYFRHMRRFAPFLNKERRESGICHLMPMKRTIAGAFLQRCEDLHKKPFWVAFLEAVDYYHSGASEYELLFEFGLTFFPDVCEIRRLEWTNSPTITPGFGGAYEACHHYMRPKPG